MNIYLDIDGVLLQDSLANSGKPANHALELLKFVTENHTCFWLTTHCHGGENHVEEYLLKRFPEAEPYLDKFQPTDWNTWKTEAIDFNQDFRWIEDDVYEPEYAKLSTHNSKHKLILIDLIKYPDELKDVLSKLSLYKGLEA